MSSPIRCCCAIVFLTTVACAPRSSESARHPSAEARNAETEKADTEKKPRKQRQPVVAPPPAYGNKIVRGVEQGDLETAALACRL